VPAAFVWVSSYFVPDEFRKVMADPYLACFALMAVWGWVRGTRGALLLAYAGLGLAFLAKGPVVFVHVVTPLLLYHLLYRRRLPGSVVVHLIGLLVAVGIGLPWYVYIYKVIPNVIDIWHFESIGELTDNLNNVRPWWFYVPNLFQISLPWTPVWVLAIALPFIRQSRIANRRSRLLPFLWFALVVLFFSFVNLKKNAYLLPAMPALVLLTTQGLLFVMAAVRRRGPKSPAAWVAAAESLIGLGFAAVLPFLVHRAGMGLPAAVLFGLIPAAVAWMALGELRRGRVRGWLGLTTCACVLAVLVFFNLHLTPEENARRSPRPACAFITGVLENDPQATVIPGKLPVEASVYLPRDLRENPAAVRVLYLLDDKSKTDAGAFAQRLPEYVVEDVRPMMVPGAGKRYRWRLFVVTVSRKVVVMGVPPEVTRRHPEGVSGG
jgi:4-amino-4-deoxy-L-arabinose transferase-like glycosyltransferase